MGFLKKIRKKIKKVSFFNLPGTGGIKSLQKKINRQIKSESFDKFAPLLLPNINFRGAPISLSPANQKQLLSKGTGREKLTGVARNESKKPGGFGLPGVALRTATTKGGVKAKLSGGGRALKTTGRTTAQGAAILVGFHALGLGPFATPAAGASAGGPAGAAAAGGSGASPGGAAPLTIGSNPGATPGAVDFVVTASGDVIPSTTAGLAEAGGDTLVDKGVDLLIDSAPAVIAGATTVKSLGDQKQALDAIDDIAGQAQADQDQALKDLLEELDADRKAFEDSQNQASNVINQNRFAKRRRRSAQRGPRSTILTTPLGLTNEPNLASKTLLGS